MKKRKMGDTPERERKECRYGECRGSKEEKQGAREALWEAVWIRVQASLCEVAIGRRDPGFFDIEGSGSQ
jgi:hypothetical protein